VNLPQVTEATWGRWRGIQIGIGATISNSRSKCPNRPFHSNGAGLQRDTLILNPLGNVPSVPGHGGNP